MRSSRSLTTRSYFQLQHLWREPFIKNTLRFSRDAAGEAETVIFDEMEDLWHSSDGAEGAEDSQNGIPQEQGLSQFVTGSVPHVILTDEDEGHVDCYPDESLPPVVPHPTRVISHFEFLLEAERERVGIVGGRRVKSVHLSRGHRQVINDSLVVLRQGKDGGVWPQEFMQGFGNHFGHFASLLLPDTIDTTRGKQASMQLLDVPLTAMILPLVLVKKSLKLSKIFQM